MCRFPDRQRRFPTLRANFPRFAQLPTQRRASARPYPLDPASHSQPLEPRGTADRRAGGGGLTAATEPRDPRVNLVIGEQAPLETNRDGREILTIEDLITHMRKAGTREGA